LKIDSSTQLILMKTIDKNITIEDLVEQYPFSVRYMAEHGIRCIACGEPIWGTLEEACKEKGMDEDKIDEIVTELVAISNEG
jgi:methionine synthase II (cobalamin-independent)